jgi:hypothetical protein
MAMLRRADLTETQQFHIRQWIAAIEESIKGYSLTASENPLIVADGLIGAATLQGTSRLEYFGLDEKTRLRYWEPVGCVFWRGCRQEREASLAEIVADGAVGRTDTNRRVMAVLASLLADKGKIGVRSGRSIYADCLSYNA